MIRGVLNEGGIVEAEGDEDGLFVGDFRLEPEGHAISAMEDILIEDIEVAVVADGGVD